MTDWTMQKKKQQWEQGADGPGIVVVIDATSLVVVDTTLLDEILLCV